MNLKSFRAPFAIKAETPGAVTAVFSTFDVVDSDGDVVLASAFTHGQEVPMVWSHDWAMPVGKGRIMVEGSQAVFDGGFFMETDTGKEAYATVKSMGALQEWSWGFRVTDATWEQRGEEMVRLIKGAEVYEVSPVLKGAGIGTHTLGIKSGLPYSEQGDAVLAAVHDLLARSKALAALRAKEGRVLSGANRKRLGSLLEALQAVETDINDLLASTAPEPEKGADVLRLFTEFQRITATLNGVA